MSDDAVHVAVGVITNKSGEFLLTRRAACAHQGGLWEFPGGKVEQGEQPRQALKRELAEELAIEVDAAHPLIKVPFDYPDKSVLLDVWWVIDWRGKPSGQQGQALKWVSVQDLSNIDFPAANRTIVTAVSLPSLYVITESPGANFLTRLEHCIGAGAALVQLRAPELNVESFTELAGSVRELCTPDSGKRTRLLVNAEPEAAMALGVDGVHLSSRRLMQLKTRPLSGEYLIGASCHNAEELRQAERVGCDFVVLGPVLQTTSHPGTEPMGWSIFRSLVNRCRLPVYALGGLQPEDISTARSVGAQGLSMISGIWQAPDLASAVKRAMGLLVE